MEKIKVNVLAAIPGYAKGQTVMVEIDQDGTPIERFWRRRLSDAKTDHCIEVVLSPKKSAKTTSKGFKSKTEEETTS